MDADDQPQYRVPAFGSDETYTITDFHEALRFRLSGPPPSGEDPQAENLRRAAFAAEALHTYGKRVGLATGESIFLVVSDFLSDLRHLLDGARGAKEGSEDSDHTLEALSERGAIHYEAEIRGAP